MIDLFQKLETRKTYLILQGVLAFFLVNLFFSDFNCRKDLSKENRFDLTESTEKVINSLPEKLYIDAFYSEDVPGMHKARLTLAKEILKEIASVNRKKVELRFYNPDGSESAKKKATEAGIRSFPLEKLERGSAEVKQAYFGIKITLGSKSEVIPVGYSAETLEYQILTLLKKMTRKEGSSSMALLKANGAHTAPDPNMGGMGMGKDTFGVVIHEVFAKEYGAPEEVNVNEEPIPEEFNILLWVGAPDLSPKGEYHIDQFLMRGGNLIILGKSMEFTLPGRQRGMPSMGNEGIAISHNNTPKINEFLKKYGVEIRVDMILEPEHSMVTNSFIQVQPGVFSPYHYPLWPVPTKESKQLSQSSIITKNSSGIILPWVSGIDIIPEKQPKAKYDTVIHSTKGADRRENYVMLGEEQVANQEIKPVGINIPLAVHISGEFKSGFSKEDAPKTDLNHLEKTRDGKSSQIFITGTPYLISDLLISNQHVETFQKTNLPFFINLVDIFSGDTDLLATRTKQAYIRNLKPVSKPEQIFFSFMNIFLVPIAIGIFAFIRLKKRNSARK
jgi:ABC-type uncharacterized transport system involved in gliding motility auxiliary subunit